jgi:hypothetical protein
MFSAVVFETVELVNFIFTNETEKIFPVQFAFALFVPLLASLMVHASPCAI